MRKIIFCLALTISSSVFAVGDRDSFYSVSGAIVSLGDTRADLLNKMQTNQRPSHATIKNNRGRSVSAEVYTFEIETMIYKVYILKGKVFKITSDYS